MSRFIFLYLKVYSLNKFVLHTKLVSTINHEFKLFWSVYVLLVLTQPPMKPPCCSTTLMALLLRSHTALLTMSWSRLSPSSLTLFFRALIVLGMGRKTLLFK